MDFAFNEAQELLRTTVRRFLEKRHPLSRTRRELETADAFDRDAWREGAALGWTAPFVPEPYGGGSVTDQPLVDLALVAEETGRVLYPGPFLATNLVAFALAEGGSESQRRELLPRLAAGESIATWCFTGDGGAAPDAVDVRAEVSGSEVRLDGVARFVPDAHVSDRLLVTARSAGHLVQLLVPVPRHGVSIRVMRTLDLTRRLCEVRFDGVTVPAGAFVGSPGGSTALAGRLLAVANVLLCAESVGLAERVLDMTVEYAKVRVQFGRPIGSFQAIKHKLADMLLRLETSRAATHYAALAVADRLADAEEAVSTARAYVGGAASELCGEALQTHGGIGFTWEHDMHLYLRRAKSLQVLFGDSAWHRERLCGLAGV